MPGASDRCILEWYCRSNTKPDTPSYQQYCQPRDSAAAEAEASHNAELDHRLQESAATARYKMYEQERSARELREANGRDEATALALRLLIELRFGVLVARIGDNAPLSPDDYRQVIYTAYPEADMMQPWANRAAAITTAAANCWRDSA